MALEDSEDPGLAAIPSVDKIARYPEVQSLLDAFGRTVVLTSIRSVLAVLRATRAHRDLTEARIAKLCREEVCATLALSQKRVHNLTGTVLHTNFGRAVLPDAAIAATIQAMSAPVNLEFDLTRGGRGERDDHIRGRLRRLTGAEDATIVNNNAAAVILVLNTLALRREVLISRGELIEIGGSFRMTEIMERAGCRLREVGTTNRTYLRDFANAIGPETALIVKVHASNFRIDGFAAAVPEEELTDLAHAHGVPFIVDLGSGSLVNLEAFGLPHEPTPAESLHAGADLVTFSGDKLLGGPQAGIIVGATRYVQLLNANPMKRALRVDKLRVAALDAVLSLYECPERLPFTLPTLRALTRPAADIATQTQRLVTPVSEFVGPECAVEMAPCKSQIGSGSLPTDLLDSWGLVLRQRRRSRHPGAAAAAQLAGAFRRLPVPVIGRVHNGALNFDLRCLDDEPGFIAQLPRLGAHG